MRVDEAELTYGTAETSPTSQSSQSLRSRVSLSSAYEAVLFLVSKCHCKSLPMSSAEHRKAALDWSLYSNVAILVVKVFAFVISGSLSVLAALVDSFLDILSQFVLYWAESKSTNPSAALYPAGASRYEPVGVVICASVMGMGSLLLIKESMQQLVEYAASGDSPSLQGGGSSAYSLIAVIVLKVFLSIYCKATAALLDSAGDGESTTTIDAMYQDHFNDGLSNGIALLALWVATARPEMWWFDPLGAVLISLYIIKSWYETGMEEIDKIVGKAADKSFVDGLVQIGNSHHKDMQIDVCRCYHFGPKFLVEIECVMPPDMMLKDTHDIGMDLQYKLENLPEVERAFVHIDYSKRAYDEHIASRKYGSYQNQLRATSPKSDGSTESFEKL